MKGIGERIVCVFSEKDGSFLWQLVIPKLGAGKVSDWEYFDVCSSPLIHDGRAYFISNRCRVVCVDMEEWLTVTMAPIKKISLWQLLVKHSNQARRMEILYGFMICARS